MALSALDDPNTAPTEESIAKVLGKAGSVWASLKDELCREFAPLDEVWAFAGAKLGWSLRLKRGNRMIVYLTPCNGHFLASFALGEKACAAARAEGLPDPILRLIAEAPKYAEGRGVRIPVRTAKEASSIGKLVAIKLAS
ncbi:MAG: DUF3788 family protein [Polyangiaceae bacterium]|nr:DUF3788 family protein [Polyangiaceae bacterium]